MQIKYSLQVVLLVTFISTNAQPLSAEEVKKLVPDYLEGFNHDVEVKAKLIKVGDLQYSLCEHRFTKGKQSVRVLLFDYKDAQIMYKQVTKEWKNYSSVISDSLTFRSVKLTNCTGWESYHKNSSTSQIYIGICDRFLLNLTGEGVELEILKNFLSGFRFEKFPN